MDRNGFTLIELMIVIAIIGILAGIAIPNFIAYRNKGFCINVESDASHIAASITDYFAVPLHDKIATGDQSFVPPVNGYAILATNPDVGITIVVTDASGRCPSDYTTANRVNAQGNGWIDGVSYQKVIRY